MPDQPTLLLVHGAWHGSWAWAAFSEELERRGWDVRLVDLPSVHAADLSDVKLADDAVCIAAAIDDIDGDVVLIAHSYGGVPATEAAKSASVVHLVYIAAFVLEEGQSLLSSVGGVAPDWWQVDKSSVTVDGTDASILSHFYGDMPVAEAAAAGARLRQQSRSVFEEPLTYAAWRYKPSTYVIAELEPPARVQAQETMAARAGSRVVRMPTRHSPFMSKPKDLADVIEEAITTKVSKQSSEGA